MNAYKRHSTILGHQDSVNALDISPDGRYLASGGDDGLLLLHEINNGKRVLKLKGDTSVTSLLWSNGDVLQLYAGFGDGRVLRADLSSVRSL